MHLLKRAVRLLPWLICLLGMMPWAHAGRHSHKSKSRVSFGVQFSSAPAPAYLWAPAPVVAPVVLAGPAPVASYYYGAPACYYGAPVVVMPAPNPYGYQAGVVYYTR